MKVNKKEIFFYLVLIIVFCMSIAPKEFQNDTFFTIAVGQKILEQGIYTEETFTWHEGLKYENVRWLFDIMIATIYKIGDFFGIYVFVMVMTAIIGVTLFYIFLKKNIYPLLAFLLTIATIYLGETMLCARSQIVSFWIFILEAYFVEKLLETKKMRYTFLLFTIAVLLANVHAPVYPMFFVLFLPYIAEWTMIKLKFIQNDDSKIILEKRKNLKQLIITMKLCLFAGLCTPIGLIPYTDMFRTVGSIANDIIQEMQPISIIGDLAVTYIIVVVLGIIMFTKTKIRFVDACILVGYMLLSLSTRRSSFFFIFIGMISVGNLVNDVFKAYKVDGWNFNQRTKICGIIFLVVIFISISANNFSNRINTDYVNNADYPIEAAKYITKKLDMENMRLYNGFGIGSYLELQGIPVFLDSRAEIYLKEFNDTTILEDYMKLNGGSVYHNEIFNKYNMTHLILKNVERLNIYVKEDENWKLIYQDDNYSLYEKVEK